MDETTERVGTGRQIWTFTSHFLQMMIAMCVGGGILNALIFVAGPAVIGYPDPRLQWPAASLLLIATIYALPMVAWMRYRGMEWRPIVEMAGATIALAVAVIVLAVVGLLSNDDLHGWMLGFCMPACALMIPVMLLRLDLYTGRAGHHHAGRPPAPDSTLDATPGAQPVGSRRTS
jgi:hypothetical protein